MRAVSAMPYKRVILALGSHYIESLHRGVADFARGHHWHLTNIFGEISGLIEQRSCDGILATLMHGDAFSEAILKLGLPTVDLGIDRSELEMPHVSGDHFQMGRAAAQHFIDRGFRHFVWYSERDHAMASKRHEGFRQTLQQAGLDCAQLVLPVAFPRGAPSWRAQQQWITEKLRATRQPCAVYAYNDLQAVNLMDACLAAGLRVPEEVAVLGTDNHPLVCPTAAVPLSSIKNDLEALGRRAARELDEIMNGAPVVRKVIQIPHGGIEVRQSADVFAVNDAHVVKALHFIHENAHRSINVSDIVAVTSLSRRALEARFQVHRSRSILSTLNQVRLDRSCRLLKESALSIADIAAQTGFNTPEYFHRIFRRQIGMTPKSYRSRGPA